MTQRTATIALLTDYLVSSYQVSIIRAVERAAVEQGVSLLILSGRALRAPTVGDATQNRVYELIGSHNVDGILLVSGCISSVVGPKALADYCSRYQPVPVCSLGLELPGIPSLVVSNEQGSRALVEHLITAHGARRIAYIAGPTNIREAVDRLAGYRSALSNAGLPYLDELVSYGDFSVPAGVAVMKEFFERGVSFDAVVGANDYMAMGALDVLRKNGVRVPNEVLLGGFDDAPYARFALPSMTTVRQPLDRLARNAVEWLLKAAKGEALPDVAHVDVDVVTRQSCGCGLLSRRHFQTLPPENGRDSTALALLLHRQTLLEALYASVGVPPEALGGWAERLVDALHAELTGQAGRFHSVINALLEDAQSQPVLVDELVKVVSVLRFEMLRLRPLCEVALELEHLFYVGLVLFSNAATNAQGREKLALEIVIDAVRSGFERIGTALSLPTLHQALLEMLPDVRIQHAAFSLVDEETPESLTPFVTVVPGGAVQVSSRSFPIKQLVPTGFFTNERHSHIIVPLSLDEDFFGVMALEYSTNETVYGLLRDHVSSALKGGQLHRAALRQSALLERVEREQLEQEAKIASRIQTAILPCAKAVEGLEIAASMVPAVSVGGDYYDIVPTPNGGWIGIGDVTGHGLVAGIIMLMLQGMVASLVRNTPLAQPSVLVTSLNQALYENIRNRLGRDDHVTVTLLRYDREGLLTFSGAHEDLIVYRARTNRIETTRPPGFWSGTLADVSDLTSDTQLKLEENDVLVLYSDGVTEAMNEQGEQFGLLRLCALVETAGAKTTDEICRCILEAVEQWQLRQIDDITVLVARYHRRLETTH